MRLHYAWPELARRVAVEKRHEDAAALRALGLGEYCALTLTPTLTLTLTLTLILTRSHAQLIVVLRDPAERTLSEYKNKRDLMLKVRLTLTLTLTLTPTLNPNPNPNPNPQPPTQP